MLFHNLADKVSPASGFRRLILATTASHHCIASPLASSLTHLICWNALSNIALLRPPAPPPSDPTCGPSLPKIQRICLHFLQRTRKRIRRDFTHPENCPTWSAESPTSTAIQTYCREVGVCRI
ncbi:hypothetical protein CALVIDRAFT_96200 [Calocera viscosa TUFC12733]|uniref:Uncharacterized protein n=1 Tax=Calocera viscosa (strain TUFC12733) TaxID=1330018 RepID=A0A167MXT9_CALVF|nr:hypothetical protein CALVIDRAFT_96200 [Calocera viscosa TUFC12733]